MYAENDIEKEGTALFDLIPSLLMDQENESLVLIPSNGEIREVVFQMNASGALRPDGFSGAFYHACCDIIGKDIVAGVQQFFRESYLLPNINSVFLVLLPESADVTSISQFRPIALANFFFKIITKILANRLGPIMSRIITLTNPLLSRAVTFTITSLWYLRVLISCSSQIANPNKSPVYRGFAAF